MLKMVNDCIHFVSLGWYQYVDFFVCVCRYVVCMCLCVYMKRPEDSAGHLSFSIAAHRIFSDKVPHWTWSSWFGRWIPGLYLCPTAVLSLQASATFPGCYTGTADPDSALMFVKQACNLSHTAISPGLNMGLQQFQENEISISYKISIVIQS